MQRLFRTLTYLIDVVSSSLILQALILRQFKTLIINLPFGAYFCGLNYEITELRC